MYTQHGIAVDSWVKIGAGCPIKRDTDGFEAQFEIGNCPASLILVCTEDGLEHLISEATGALRELQANTQGVDDLENDMY